MLDVLPGSLVFYQVGSHVGESHLLVELSNCQEAGVRGYLRSPEFEPQTAVELKPNVPVLRFTRWVFSYWNLALSELPILVHP